MEATAVTLTQEQTDQWVAIMKVAVAARVWEGEGSVEEAEAKMNAATAGSDDA